MAAIYFYPKIDYKKIDSPNPYISDFESELSKYNVIVNKKYNTKGVLDLFKYFFSAEVYLFNWIEDLVNYRFGKFQIIVFAFFIFLCKIFNKKIIWVLHNKYSHDQAKNIWTDFVFHLMLKKSDLILTHSNAGVEFVKEVFEGNTNKIKFLHHPVKDVFTTSVYNEKKYDFLIWGSIFPYKGILEFLEFIKASPNYTNLKIIIAGKCKDYVYEQKLRNNFTPNVTYIDQLLSLEEIAELASSSKSILFTYKSVSVLSSGSLMDSIRMKTMVLGPNHGAFKDLSSYGFVRTYNEFNDIIISDHKFNQRQNVDCIETFCQDNSWTNFGCRFQKEIESLF